MVTRQTVNTWLWGVNYLVRITPITTAGNRFVVHLAEEVVEGIQ
jgi:hypothetical protein